MKRLIGTALLACLLASALGSAVASAAPATPARHATHHATLHPDGYAPPGCTDIIVEDTGNVRFNEGSGYVILRAALHSWVDMIDHPCGETWVNGWYYCWNANCGSTAVAHTQVGIWTTGSGGSFWTTQCHYASPTYPQGHWYSCNAPYNPGFYLDSAGYGVYANYWEDAYNVSVGTAVYPD